jgi:hypothetical protein
MKNTSCINIAFLYFLTVFFLLTSLKPVSACPAGPKYSIFSANERQNELNLFHKIKSRIIQTSSERERKVLRNIKIILCAHPHRVWALARPDGKIELSEGFVLGLNSFAESMLMSNIFQIRYLEERWHNYNVKMRHYYKRHIKTLEEYAQLSPDQLQRWNSTKVSNDKKNIYIAAISFVLAHELGHHALNAFYTVEDTDTTKQRYEHSADEWAARALLKIGIAPYLGAAISNLYLHTLNLKSTITGENSQSHPPNLERILQALKITDQLAKTLYSNKQLYPKSLQFYLGLQIRFREIIKEKLRKFNRQKNIEYWLRLTKRGSGLAAFIAGRMYAEGISTPINLENACNYYIFATIGGYDPALTLVGQCYECGMGREKDFDKALEYFKEGKKRRLSYADYRYEILKQSISDGYETTEICLREKDILDRKQNALRYNSK